MQLAITSNFVDFINSIKGVAKDQLPFATARALTKTAQDTRARALGEIATRFTLRNTFTASGIRVVPATKDNLMSALGLTDRVASYLDKFELGGVKLPKGKMLAIPMSNVRRTKRDLIMKSQRPRNLQNTFVLQTASGPILFQRFGQGKKQSIKAMYDLEPKVTIKPRLGVHQWGPDEVGKRWPGNFLASLVDAMKTRK